MLPDGCCHYNHVAACHRRTPSHLRLDTNPHDGYFVGCIRIRNCLAPIIANAPWFSSLVGLARSILILGCTPDMAH